jgi:hypothetical protein
MRRLPANDRRELIARRGPARLRACAGCGSSFPLAARAAVRPALAADLVRVAWRFRRRAWWRRFPFLPVPSMPYVRWRMQTAYGDPDALPLARRRGAVRAVGGRQR